MTSLQIANFLAKLQNLKIKNPLHALSNFRGKNENTII